LYHISVGLPNAVYLKFLPTSGVQSWGKRAQSEDVRSVPMFFIDAYGGTSKSPISNGRRKKAEKEVFEIWPNPEQVD
jgi:hypothetical protein